MSEIADQPNPQINGHPPVWERVRRLYDSWSEMRIMRLVILADMADRDRLGRERYGVPLQPHNGRDALIDAYQEALDLCAYLGQLDMEHPGEYRVMLTDAFMFLENLRTRIDRRTPGSRARVAERTPLPGEQWDCGG